AWRPWPCWGCLRAAEPCALATAVTPSFAERRRPAKPRVTRDCPTGQTTQTPLVRRRGVCVVCPVGQSRVTRGLAGRRRSAKEGVTAVASAQGSAARRQPQQGQGRQAQVQAPRKGDAPVSLV